MSASDTSSPCLIALAGPNGAGKSTAGPALIKDTQGCDPEISAPATWEAIIRGAQNES